MHSTIVCLMDSKNATPYSLDDFYCDDMPSFADYTDELPKSKYAGVAKMLCDTFCFLKPSAKDQGGLRVDHTKAKEELTERYATLSALYARMANGEQHPDNISPYWE